MSYHLGSFLDITLALLGTTFPCSNIVGEVYPTCSTVNRNGLLDYKTCHDPLLVLLREAVPTFHYCSTTRQQLHCIPARPSIK